MEKLFITVDREASEAEKQLVEEAFSPYFEVEVDNQIVRLSHGPLDLLVDIAIGVISNASYDGLKNAAQNLLRRDKPRDAAVVVRLLKRGEQLVLTNKYVALRKRGGDTEFPSIDALFVYLQERENSEK